MSIHPVERGGGSVTGREWRILFLDGKSLEGAFSFIITYPSAVLHRSKGMSYAGSQAFSSGAVMAPGLRLPSQGETPTFQGPICQLCSLMLIRAIATTWKS